MTRAERIQSKDYAELKRMIVAAGLLNEQPVYYAFTLLTTLGMLVLGGMVLVRTRETWLVLLDAIFLAFVFMRFAFIGHDLGHRQFFHASRANAIVGIVLGDLLIGMSYSWWIWYHNRHHANPNELEVDPGVVVPVLAFTEEQALEKRGLARVIVKHQAYFFFPLLCLQAFNAHFNSVKFILQKRSRYNGAEALCTAAHFVLYYGLLFYLLDFGQAVLFAGVHQVLFGLYMASVFAPNHKGMPLLDEHTQLDYLRKQVLTARNIKYHPVISFWYGGVDLQIEHHLFPTMPRNKLSEAQRIVKAFCEARGVPYYETGALQSYREILQFLHEVSAPLRADHNATPHEKRAIIL